MATYDDWRPLENYVQSGLTDGRFTNAMFFRIAAGPPRLQQIGGIQAAAGLLETAAPTVVYNIGLVQDFGFSSQTTWAQIFEIGSNRSYFIPGRNMHQVTFSSVYYHGPNLLRRAYAYYEDTEGPTTVEALFPNIGAQNMPYRHDVKIPPGYENIFWNLQSDLFTQPIGLLMYMKDISEETLGAAYLECCVIPMFNFGTDAQGVVFREQITLNFERMRMVEVSALPVIRQAA